MKLSCTTVMLPRWTLDQTFDKLAEHRYDGVELRCRYNPENTSAPLSRSFWGPHISGIDPDNIVERAAEIRAAATRTGLRVVALAPQCRLGEDEHVDKLLAGAGAIDPDAPPMIRIQALPYDRSQPYAPQFEAARAGFAAVAERAGRFGVRILYEIHAGTLAVTASRTLELLRDIDPVTIGAIYDVPNMVVTGLEDTRMGLQLLGPYLAHCHIGNRKPVCTSEPDGGSGWEWEFCGLTEGLAPIRQIIDDFKSISYDAYLSLEDFGPGDDEDKIRDQGIYLRNLIANA